MSVGSIRLDAYSSQAAAAVASQSGARAAPRGPADLGLLQGRMGCGLIQTHICMCVNKYIDSCISVYVSMHTVSDLSASLDVYTGIVDCSLICPPKTGS